MSNLSRFLVDLATNVDFKRRYSEDPQGTFDIAGLTAAERSAFTSGDSVQMRAALGKPDNDCMSQTGFMKVPVGTIITTPDGKVRTVCDRAVLNLESETDAAAAKKRKKGKGTLKAAAKRGTGGRPTRKKAGSRKRGR